MDSPPLENASIQRRIDRLTDRLETLKTWDNRYSAARLVIFVLGVFGVWLAARVSTGAANLAAVIAVGLFITAVALHRRLDRWTARFRIWRQMRKRDLARRRLDWAQLTHGSRVDRQTMGGLSLDLDLTGPRSLHHLLDLAVSVEGSQLLASWLCQDTPDVDQVLARQSIVRELRTMRRFRDRLLLNLRLVAQKQLKGADLLNWLAIELPTSQLSWLLAAGAGLVAINLVLLLLNIGGVLPPYWVLTYVLYMGLNFGNARTVGPFLEAVVELDRALDPFASLLRYLEQANYSGAPRLGELCAPFCDPARLPSASLRQTKWVTAAVGLRGNLVVWLLLNLVLPWDFLFAWLADRLRSEVAPLLPVWLETWYQLEALLSLANFAALHPDYAFPQIDSSINKVFDARALGHPLISPRERVCNDFSIGAIGAVAIITGSNMAGKSTFIKTVGLNLCLAYAGGPVCADRFHAQPLRLHTCIRISDSIADGFSYFYAEVRCLKHLLEILQEEDAPPVLYLVDEIFRGTNNRERLLGSQAYIQSLLGRRGCGLIATHDLELAHLADENEQVRNFHFKDAVADGRLVFDYKIWPGPSPTTNALKIMAMEGLPVPSTDTTEN